MHGEVTESCVRRRHIKSAAVLINPGVELFCFCFCFCLPVWLLFFLSLQMGMVGGAVTSPAGHRWGSFLLSTICPLHPSSSLPQGNSSAPRALRISCSCLRPGTCSASSLLGSPLFWLNCRGCRCVPHVSPGSVSSSCAWQGANPSSGSGPAQEPL